MTAVYVIWYCDEACPNCTATLTEIGLEDGSTTQECRWCSWSAWWRPDRLAVMAGDRDWQDDTGAADGHAAGP